VDLCRVLRPRPDRTPLALTVCRCCPRAVKNEDSRGGGNGPAPLGRVLGNAVKELEQIGRDALRPLEFFFWKLGRSAGDDSGPEPARLPRAELLPAFPSDLDSAPVEDFRRGFSPREYQMGLSLFLGENKRGDADLFS